MARLVFLLAFWTAIPCIASLTLAPSFRQRPKADRTHSVEVAIVNRRGERSPGEYEAPLCQRLGRLHHPTPRGVLRVVDNGPGVEVALGREDGPRHHLFILRGQEDGHGDQQNLCGFVPFCSDSIAIANFSRGKVYSRQKLATQRGTARSTSVND